jgi:hypothetical protein
MNAQQRAMQKATGAAGLGMPGAGSPGPGGMSAAQMQAMQQAAMANAAASPVADPTAMGGLTKADAEALVTFQQEMMQLSMAASAGDAKATARLEAWQLIALKYQAEMQKLGLAAGAGDVTAAQRMQRMQFDLIREWNAGGAHAKLPKAKRP